MLAHPVVSHKFLFLSLPGHESLEHFGHNIYTRGMLSVTRGTAPTATGHALNRLILLQLRLGYATDAGCVEIRLFSLNAPEATQL